MLARSTLFDSSKSVFSVYHALRTLSVFQTNQNFDDSRFVCFSRFFADSLSHFQSPILPTKVPEQSRGQEYKKNHLKIKNQKNETNPKNDSKDSNQKKQKNEKNQTKTKNHKKKNTFEPRGTVVIVGRPNVGKSTLFNKLVGKQMAIVDPTPGTTRDWCKGEASLVGVDFYVIDTPGLDEHYKLLPSEEVFLKKSMTKQTESAIKEANVIFFVIDGKEGLTHEDEELADWLRIRNGKLDKPCPIVVLANKGENLNDEDVLEVSKLGFEHFRLISAYHNLGIDNLVEILYHALPEAVIPQPIALKEISQVSPVVNHSTDLNEPELLEMISEADKVPVDVSMREAPPMIQLAIIGRPNVGKSTLINALIGESRLVVSPTPHTTRDSVHIDFDFRGRQIRFIDTSGLSGTSGMLRKNLTRLHGLMMDNAIYSLKRANVCAFVVDIEPHVASSDLLSMIKAAKGQKLYNNPYRLDFLFS